MDKIFLAMKSRLRSILNLPLQLTNEDLNNVAQLVILVNACEYSYQESATAERMKNQNAAVVFMLELNNQIEATQQLIDELYSRVTLQR